MEEQVKKRLVGAIVLVALAAIFVPFLLEEKEQLPQSAVELQREIPVQPQRKFRSDLIPDEKTATEEALKPKSAEDEFIISERLDLGEYQPPPPPSSRSSQTSTGVQETQREPAGEPDKASASSEGSRADNGETTPADTQKPSTPTKGWIIQAGAFAKKSGADKTHKILVDEGMSPYIEEIRVDEKRLYLVRLGPFSSKSKAQQNLNKVEKKTGHKGMVKHLK
ncbi:MAG: SPOR domain-containing protein [Pseudomonadota bacterium]